MKIVVIGGTGLIGSKAVAILRQGGHEVLAASPNSGVPRGRSRPRGAILRRPGRGALARAAGRSAPRPYRSRRMAASLTHKSLIRASANRRA